LIPTNGDSAQTTAQSFPLNEGISWAFDEGSGISSNRHEAPVRRYESNHLRFIVVIALEFYPQMRHGGFRMSATLAL